MIWIKLLKLVWDVVRLIFSCVCSPKTRRYCTYRYIGIAANDDGRNMMYRPSPPDISVRWHDPEFEEKFRKFIQSQENLYIPYWYGSK